MWMLVLSALAFLLGLIALLCTKIYVTTSNGATQSTEVDMPLIGKMKTNYPALVFVTAGAALAVYTLYQYSQLMTQPVLWNIKGQLQQPNNGSSDVRWGEIRLVDLDSHVTIDKDGTYEINVEIPAGRTFESVVQQIYYTTRNGNAVILPGPELETYQHGDKSKSQLLTATNNTRIYRPTMVMPVADAASDTGAPQ
jgi:hypothetical protein